MNARDGRVEVLNLTKSKIETVSKIDLSIITYKGAVQRVIKSLKNT